LPDYSAVVLLVVFPADWVGADVGVSVRSELGGGEPLPPLSVGVESVPSGVSVGVDSVGLGVISVVGWSGAESLLSVRPRVPTPAPMTASRRRRTSPRSRLL
jgi:hypothetical protein